MPQVNGSVMDTGGHRDPIAQAMSGIVASAHTFGAGLP